TELTFNCQGNPLKVTEFTRGIRPSDPDRFTTTYTYNLNGLVTSVTQPEGNRIDYVYDARSTGDKTIDQLFAENRIQITQISDEDRSGGTSLQSNFTYEPVYNQVLTKTDPDSNTITYYYDYQEGSDFAALAARMNMPESTVRTLLRDVPMARGDLNGDSNTAQLRGNLVRVDQPPLTTEDDTILSYRFRYNGFGQRTSKIKPDGTQDEYSYADNGYLSQIAQDTAGLNITNQYEYDAVGNLIVFVDGNRNRIEFRVNALNQVSRERLPIGAVRNILYDANNNVIQVDEPNLDNEGRAINDNPYITARYEYNILNRPIARIQEVSEGSTILTEYQYDANENLTRVVEPKGNSIAIVYDERDLPYKITKGYASADASTTIINYDGNKDKTQVRDGNGNQTNYIYDGFDRLIQIQDPRGNITRYTYNVLNKSTRIEKQGKTDSRSEESILLQDIRLFYDELGRLISKQEAILNAGEISGNHNLSYQYDVNNRLVRFVDGLGHATHMIYDGLDRLISKTDAKGNRLEYTYDANNNITRQTSLEINDVNASTTAFATSVAYDAINRPITITDNLGHTNQYRYDSRGNLIYSSDPRDLSGLDEGVNAA
ncbi:MAG: hypothetical protein COS89_08960, partial [Deltaproteobacteria bacterium CG07_land_8_20_14_0_80_38_7]